MSEKKNAPLHGLLEQGQSVWYDNIARGLIKDGTLANLITDYGVRGVTSNPAIFEKALSAGTDYDDQMKELIAQGKSALEIFDAAAIQDIGDAADIFRPVYDSSNGLDGYISIEVAPNLAHDTEGTLVAARNFFKLLNRPNIMIKVPATPAGLPAITELIGDGINVNVTLIFAIEAYENVANAYIAGLEKLAASGKKPLGQVASVASFFVSRVDSMVDKMLDEKIAAASDESEKSKLENLKGKAGIANSKLAYQKYLEIFSGERWEKLKAQGAHPQRLLWASTGTKNPKYSDVLYVDNLIGPDTVNTMPPQTVLAFGDHGKVARTIDQNVDEAQAAFDGLEAAGISMTDVTEKLLAEGVRLFVEPFDKMIANVETKRQKLQAELEVAR
jgi:transaldolase / glucose-6-phosphate isomerase